MLQNPFDPQKNPGIYMYASLPKRVLKNVRASGIDDQIFNAVQKAFEEALEKEKMPLPRQERKRLLAQVMKQVLSDMLTKLDKSAKA